MTEPTFDAHGYPTVETLEAIKKWDIVNGDPYELVEFVHKAWHWQDWGWSMKRIRSGEDKGKHKLYISTGGWSGNELLLSALEDTPLFMALFWVSSHRGGHHEFVIFKVKKGKENATKP